MKTNKVILITFLMGLFLIGTFDAEAQKKKRRPVKEEETKERTTIPTSSFADNLTYDIFVGNLQFSSNFYTSAKFGVGYKVQDFISVGLSPKLSYLFQNRPAGQEDVSIFDYGIGPWARFKVAETFYVQAEYDFMSFDLGSGPRINESGFLAGIGYLSGFGDWKFGLQLLFVFSDNLRNNSLAGEVVEYYFGATYNF